MEYRPVKYGYARESTNDQKQNIGYQIKYLKEQGVDDINIYKEYASGTKEDRIEYQKLLSLLKPGDSLYVTEISRLSRSTKQLIETINYIKDNHIQLVIGSLNVDCRNSELDPMVKGMLQMMGVFAELERDIISQRVKEGLANAENVGRPKFGEHNIPDKFYKYYSQFKKGSIVSKVDFCKLLGVSRPTLDKYIGFVENQNG
jgi:DNA invertase Pin-like site-specific DNA recombinase